MFDVVIVKEVQVILDFSVLDIEFEVVECVGVVVQLIGMSVDKIDEVCMVVVEVCINVVEYSGLVDGELYFGIVVLWEMGGVVDESLQVMISDYGVGFDFDKLVELDIGKKFKVVNKCGWGFKIIEGLMDWVDVCLGVWGMFVVMLKYC